jgi:hypothetical protein
MSTDDGLLFSMTTPPAAASTTPASWARLGTGNHRPISRAASGEELSLLNSVC